jgi:hypothetical protein
MRVRTFALALLASVISVSTLHAQVQGSEIVENADSFQGALVEVVAFPMTQGEIDYLLENVDDIVAWAAENQEEWDAVDEAEDALPAIKALSVWDATGVSMSPFIAILLKTQIAHQVKTQGFTAEQLNSQIDQAEEMMDSGVIPAEQMAEMEEQLEWGRMLAAALENYPEENLALYDANAEAVAAALESFNNASDDAGDGS